MEKIGVFCSACDSIDDIYFTTTTEFGEWIGKNNKTLIYGGADLGLMECIAKAVKTNGGKVIGVVPSILEEKGKVSKFVDTIHQTNNLSDRKDFIMEHSDVFVALPGGIGTVDEIFHVMGAATIGYHSKKVILYNVDGFYNEIIEVMETLNKKGFIRRPLNVFYDVANTFEELTGLLK